MIGRYERAFKDIKQSNHSETAKAIGDTARLADSSTGHSRKERKKGGIAYLAKDRTS